MKTFAESTMTTVFRDDYELFILNGGPGGNYDKVVRGPVI